MRTKTTLLLVVATLALLFIFSWAKSDDELSEREKRARVDTRVDNNGYYIKKAKEGLYTLNPYVDVEPAVYTGSALRASSVLTEDSPDVPVTEINSTQSENSIFVDPNNENIVLQSNNSTSNPVSQLFGANDFFSLDGGETWLGEIEGAGGNNSGDPTTAISNDGRWYVNYISDPGGQGISYSDDQGLTWTAVSAAPNPGGLADKNHMWIDNAPLSPYNGNLYIAYTDFGGFNDGNIVVVRSTNKAESWTSPLAVSSTAGGDFNQGVHLQTGPNGEVYAFWAVYDSQSNLDEDAIGMAKSLDGGETWSTPVKIIDNIRGIRDSEIKKNHRKNSFPVASVDFSTGNVYVVWPNIGTPGINEGPDIDIYMIKSTDQGDNWSDPIRVNQDEAGMGHIHYFSWITCDQSSGVLSVIFYDDRNVGGAQLEVFCANSYDEGETWEDFKVSDVAFTPSPIPGLAGGYMGDYLGISAYNGKVYPVWTDNRLGYAMTFTSPYETNPLARPFDLQYELTFESGQTDLTWAYEPEAGFQNFNIYRNSELIASTEETSLTDFLPDYGVFTYEVSAFYGEETGESGRDRVSLQWGDGRIEITPDSIWENIALGTVMQREILVRNVGELDLNYSISAFSPVEKDPLEYCSASGGGDEFISRVQFKNIDNSTGSDNYADFTSLFASIEAAEKDTVIITNGNSYPSDQVGVWVDWNQDEVFDEDESATVLGSPGSGPYFAIIEPPQDALNGATRMRIRLTYVGAVEPCGTTAFGEVEDYTLIVNNWFSYDVSEGTIEAGGNQLVTLTLNASAQEEGLYQSNLIFSSNDPDIPEYRVPVYMNVIETAVFVTADQNAVCLGKSVSLQSEVIGGNGTETYSWTSIPPGFTSTDPNPVDIPSEGTWYKVEVTLNDGGILLADSVFVEVFPLPEIHIGPDTWRCTDEEVTYIASWPNSSYLWFNGSTDNSVTISSDGTPGVVEVSVVVTDQNGCAQSDTSLVTFEDCTGIGENAVNGLKVYPNPSKGLFWVETPPGAKGELKARVLDLQGRLVMESFEQLSAAQSKFSIDLNGKRNGTYIVLVEIGDQVFKAQLILQP